MQVYLQLRDALYLDDAVSGEAAGLAMGLVMVGSLNSAAFQDMVQYTCDTQHDKIQRGLRSGIALLAYGVSLNLQVVVPFPPQIVHFSFQFPLFTSNWTLFQKNLTLLK